MGVSGHAATEIAGDASASQADCEERINVLVVPIAFYQLHVGWLLCLCLRWVRVDSIPSDL